MPRYLLACECGNKVSIEPGQAGGQAACSCGRILAVPPLRHLRHLPVEQQEPVEAPSPWNARRGVVAAFLIVAGILVIAVASIWLSEPKPDPFDITAENEALDKGLEAITPAESWERWAYLYRRLAEEGLSPPPPRLTAAEIQRLERMRFLEKALLVAAGLSLATAAIVALWPAQPKQRQAARRQG